MLLEPIMRLEVTVPDEHVGDIVGDLQQRRAIITRTHTRGRNTVIEAHAPLANLFGYSSAMRGLSQGLRHLHHGAAQLRAGAGTGAGRVYVRFVVPNLGIRWYNLYGARRNCHASDR